MNSKVVLLLSVASLAIAKPNPILTTNIIGTPLLPITPISSSQYHTQDEYGQYSYGYANGLSSKMETKTIDGITRGGYSYIDAEGKLQRIDYTSDAINGFRVIGTNLPVAPVAPLLKTTEISNNNIDKKIENAEDKEKARTDILEVDAPANVIPAALPYFHQPILPFTSSLSYSYGIPMQHFTTYSYGTPAITTYAAPVVAPLAAHIPQLKDIPTMPVAPMDTPEVAKARADHLVEFEKVKSRTA